MTIEQQGFEAPGKGSWELETTHAQRPFTLFTGSAMAGGMPRGFRLATARYGLLLSQFEIAQVNGFIYSKLVAFGAPEGAAGLPSRALLHLLTRLHPRFRARLKTGARALEQKIWREDLRLWDEEVKPAAARLQRAYQQVDVGAISDRALVQHIEALWHDLERHFEIRHSFTVAAIMAVGDFLAHALEWTGKSAGEVLGALRGSSPVSAGIAREELAVLVAALRGDDVATALCRSARPAADILEALRDRPDTVGEAARAYVDLVGIRCVGYDLGEGTALDFPEVLVRAIVSALDGEQLREQDQAIARAAALRALVPAEHRAGFDELLHEARLTNRLRDERGNHTDSWLNGLARRAVLEGGARLVAAGVLPRASLLLDASLAEMVGLLRGHAGPSADELETRRIWRETRTVADAPPWLGAPPAAPPPIEWLPSYARRAARAVQATTAALYVTPGARKDERSVEGLSVGPGVYEGRARLVLSPADFGKIQAGDVLVTRTTSPTFNVLLPLLGGIVTDRGGQLSHAAIVAREYGIPAVVGTSAATTVFRDGDRLRIDGTNGRVERVA